MRDIAFWLQCPTVDDEVEGSNPDRAEISLEILTFVARLRPLANSVAMSTLTLHCRWDIQTVRERTGHRIPAMPSVGKMKSLTLRT